MLFWNEFVDLLEAGIFTMAQGLGGNVGAGIVCFSLLARLAMLPLTLYMAQRAQAHRDALEKLRPELERLRKRFNKQPKRLAEESAKLFERQGVQPIDGGSLLGGLVQMPWMLGLFSAVRKVAGGGGRFLWIPDIARPDLLLTVAVSAITAVSMALQPHLPEQNRTLILVLPTVLSFLFLSKMPAGVGLYWGASSAVGFLQVGVLRRMERRRTATGERS